jgi:hypothetical protein
MKSHYNYAYWNVPTPELLELGLLSSSAEVSGYLKYELHIKEIVL